MDFLAGLYREKLESRTVARHLVTLRNFFRFAQIQDLITTDPSVESGVAEDSAIIAGVFAARGSRAIAEPTGSKTGAGFAGPRDAGGVVFDGIARFGTG